MSTPRTGAAKYIASLRNPRKADYARAYWDWLCRADGTRAPDYPGSVHEAYAVRVQIRQWVRQMAVLTEQEDGR